MKLNLETSEAMHTRLVSLQHRLGAADVAATIVCALAVADAILEHSYGIAVERDSKEEARDVLAGGAWKALVGMAAAVHHVASHLELTQHPDHDCVVLVRDLTGGQPRSVGCGQDNPAVASVPEFHHGGRVDG